MTRTGQACYCNPIIPRNGPDPFILEAEGAYVLFCTGQADDGRFIPIYRSTDLVDWRFVRGAVAAGPRADSWNRRNFWAPEVLVHDRRYWLYYTAMPDGTPKNTGNRIGVAVADRPDGPYEDRGPVLGYASLDGSPFRDEGNADGALYLYHTAEFGTIDDQAGQPTRAAAPPGSPPMAPGRIYVDRLIGPDRAAGRPVELVGGHIWQEGPVVLRRDGRYFLFYSTGSWGKADYCVRWSVGDSPAGPFVEQPEVLLASNEQVKGPGHHNFFVGPDGGDWIVYHGWDPAFAVGRLPRIDRLVWRAGRPTTPGPTFTPQEL